MNKPFPPWPQPCGLNGSKSSRLEQAAPLLRPPEGNGHAHPAVMTVVIETVVQHVEPEALSSGPVHGFNDNQPSARHSHRLIQHTLRVLAVMKRQQHECRIKRVVYKWKPNTVIGHITPARDGTLQRPPNKPTCSAGSGERHRHNSHRLRDQARVIPRCRAPRSWLRLLHSVA